MGGPKKTQYTICGMTDPTDPLLLGHLLGALDDEEHERVDALVEHDDRWRQALLEWRRRLAPLEAMRPDFDAPPGLAKRTCRFVAAHIPALDAASDVRRRMTPCPMPPSRIPGLGWLDAATVGLLVATAVMLVFPAIDGARFQARLASCQNGLRQFGVALSQYGFQQRSGVTQLADSGHLTQAGVAAVGRLSRDRCLDESPRTLCPDAWLTAQGVLPAALRIEDPSRETGNEKAMNEKGVGIVYFVPENTSAPSFRNHDLNWSGTWRGGMTTGRQAPPMPAETPLLADAPSADLPDQDLSSHGGQGRNFLYEDGRVDFVPSPAVVQPSGLALLQGPLASTTGFSTPVVWVSGRR
jgi:hypothetical protein